MQQSVTRRQSGFLLVASLALVALLAAPAQAGGNEFDDGFQDELGRIVASEAFFLGKWLLAGAYHHATHHPHAAREPYDRGSRDAEWDAWGAPAAREPCDVEYHERVRRDRYGEVVEYERREVCRRPLRRGDRDD